MQGHEEIDYLSAIEEGKFVIAQANAATGQGRPADGRLILQREAGESIGGPERVQYMDVSPRRSCQWLPPWCRFWSTMTRTAP